jgi:hypothetical protein
VGLVGVGTDQRSIMRAMVAAETGAGRVRLRAMITWAGASQSTM